MSELSLFLIDEAATLVAGQQLARALDTINANNHLIIYLRGQLGAGKTTLSRGILTGLGHRGTVKSPTYTLVEPYELPSPGSTTTKMIYHFDLYRLKDPQELEFLGAQEYFDHGFLCLVEWPEQGQEFLPAADLSIELLPEGAGRRLTLSALSETGEQLLTTFSRLPFSSPEK